MQQEPFADRPMITELARDAGCDVSGLELNPWEVESQRTPITRAWLRSFSTSDDLRAWVPVTTTVRAWSAEFGASVQAELSARLAPLGIEAEDLPGAWRRANQLAPAGYLVGLNPLEGHFGLWRIPREVRGRPVDNDMLTAIWDGRITFVTF